jgi:tRNA pseudouridine38-40 synthase
VTLFDAADSSPPAAPAGPLVRVRMEVAYDGGRFRGFAAQPGGVRTVAGLLSGALERVLRLPAPPALTCAGRTDAGVHAWGQVVHVDLSVPSGVAPDLRDLRRRLIKLLAPEVVVRSVSVAPHGWDARRSAVARHYRYTVCNRDIPDPFLHGYVWLVDQPLDLRAMRLACDPLIGEHDFTSFCRKLPPSALVPPGGMQPSGAGLVRRVLVADWHDLGDGLLRFDISAPAFCQQMVRSVVGTMVDVGLGKRRAGEMSAIVRARDRGAAGQVAPPAGLCLWEVTYPPD